MITFQYPSLITFPDKGRPLRLIKFAVRYNREYVSDSYDDYLFDTCLTFCKTKTTISKNQLNN